MWRTACIMTDYSIMSRNRNLTWLSEQQDKLSARRSPSPSKDKPVLLQTLQPTLQMAKESLAFSNPIYEEFQGPFLWERTPKGDFSVVKPLPVPKPRKTRVTPILPSPQLSIEEETYENYPESLEKSQAVVSSTSFLYFDQELPAKMAQLLDEIETLAESLASSDFEEETEGDTTSSATSTLKPNSSSNSLCPPEPTSQRQSTFRRKKIEVKKELFKFSFSSGSDFASPSPTPDLSNPLDILELYKTPKNTDSGVFSIENRSSGEGMTTTTTEQQPFMSQANVRQGIESVEEDLYPMAPQENDKKSIPPSPPPRIPPRMPRYVSEGKTRKKSQPDAALSAIPTYPPPPIPQPKPETVPSAPSNKSSLDPPPVIPQAGPELFLSKSIKCTSTSPKPPPQPTVPLLQPLFLNSEVLSLEHLHLNKLSLQRSGYMWKTGPNYRNFKYRWCILYRHNIDLADANMSYYFNRSSISASLSGKLMISDIEFVGITETVPGKTRLPKLEKSEEVSGGGSESVAFLEIGVRSRQGRVYLFAARAVVDRQLWLHAFVQALSLHAFKNKELYFFGYIRAKFTITASWQNCFALLTTDRFLYIFEMTPTNTSDAALKSIDCKNYHVFNLRKTVRISRLDDPTGINVCPAINATFECKNGFSLTQNGGRVVYMVADFEAHIARWFRAIMKFWPTPEEPEKMIFEEQYLTKGSVPVAIDKCLKYLDTFHLNEKVPLFTNVETAHPIVIANSTKLLADFRANAWAVHLLPQQHTPQQVSLLLLLILRSMNQCIFTEAMLGQWMKISETIEKEEAGAMSKATLDSLKKMLQSLSFINYATLRRIIICLANANLHYPLSTSLCKALVFTKQKTTMLSLSYARSLLTTLIKNHLYLFEVTKEEVDREMHIKRVVHLIINQRLEDQASINHQVNTAAQSCASSSRQPAVAGLSENASVPKMTTPPPGQLLAPSSIGGPPNTVIDTRQVNSLIIGIKFCTGGTVNVNECGEKVTVNVHLNKETTAKDVLNMVLEKAELKEYAKSEYALFEVVCYRRLERLVLKGEKVLPIILTWSNWPSHWCAEASLEVRHADSLMKGTLTLLHNKNKYAHMQASSTAAASSSPSTPKMPKVGPGHIRRISQSMKVRPTNGLTPTSPIASPGNSGNSNSAYSQMLMSVIQFCGMNDSRMVKKILAEYSTASLFLYCKDSHQLIGQHGVEDFFWYVGLESSSLGDTKAVAPWHYTPAPGDEPSQSASGSHPQSKGANSPPAIAGGEMGAPALTIVNKRLVSQSQSKDRLNFGDTLLFHSWNELYTWIRALLLANEKSTAPK